MNAAVRYVEQAARAPVLTGLSMGGIVVQRAIFDLAWLHERGF